MNKPTLTMLMLFVLLLLLTSGGTFLIPATAAPPIKVAIQEDGSIMGTSNILRNGDQYSLMGDVDGALYVLKDNIVIDGAGYTVTGENGRGIVLKDRQGVTLKNTRVTVNIGYLIDLGNASDCELIGNTLVGAPNPMLGPIAVHLLHSQRIIIKDNTITNFFEGLSLSLSSGHTITGNTFTDGVNGIVIDGTSDSTFRGNQMINCSFSIRAFGSPDFQNDLDISNTVDGKPIYYWVNKKDQTVPSDAAYVALVKCTGMLIEDSSPHGITLVQTTDATISKVEMVGRGRDNIQLLECSSIHIVNSVLHDRGVGIRIMNSSNCTVSGNDISNQITRGIDLSNAVDTLISHNCFADNGRAIASSWRSPSKETIIEANNFTRNGCAIALDEEMKVFDNYFEENEQALFFSECSGAVVTQNSFAYNKVALYFRDASGNIIFQNNFIYNERQVSDEGVNVTSTYFLPPSPSVNQFDKDGRGNYWIDYLCFDKNSDGIGDTSYFVYENNQDNYPLMKPVLVKGAQVVPGKQPFSIPMPNATSAGNDNTQSTLAISGIEIPIALLIAIIICAGLLVYFKKNRKEHAADLHGIGVLVYFTKLRKQQETRVGKA